MKIPRSVRKIQFLSYQRINKSRLFKLIIFVFFITSFTYILKSYVLEVNQVEEQPFFNQVDFYDDVKIDWHDYKYLEYEAHRKGLGEHGHAVVLENPVEIELNKRLHIDNGFSAVISDKISVNRSIPDIRHKECRKKQYRKHLPSVSVVIIFYNEYWSTLIRTVYSVLNRSPPELLKEIILVNDGSEWKNLYKPLEDFIAKNLAHKVKLFHLPERSGLIVARVAGMKKATGDVLVVLDSHTETNTNWLPPLLEPIAEDYRTCVCPFIDVIEWNTFKYRSQDEGKRGAFDWQFYYKRLPLLEEDLKRPTEPFNSPVMAGGLFAISAQFFWEIGGYDEGLDIWGGEQYELSFKIWQCGGRLLDAPCSRVGHIYRGPGRKSSNPRGTNFLLRNFKRVAEVWMDEYKQYLYERNPGYASVDTGDISKQLAVRENLQCKPFKWFIEKIAFDLVQKYPVRDPSPFATGAIQSMANPNLCIDTLNRKKDEPIGLYLCASNLTYPQGNQNFILTYFRDIRAKQIDKCLDAQRLGAEVILFSCHESQGNQLFRYDYEKNIIYHGKPELKHCLEANLVKRKLFIAKCDENKESQKWKWGQVYKENLDNWLKYGQKIL